jgi:hypothetical protein
MNTINLWRHIKSCQYDLPYGSNYGKYNSYHAHYDDGHNHYKFGGIYYHGLIEINYACGFKPLDDNDEVETCIELQLPQIFYLAVEEWDNWGSIDFPSKLRLATNEEIEAAHNAEYEQWKANHLVARWNAKCSKKFMHSRRNKTPINTWYIKLMGSYSISDKALIWLSTWLSTVYKGRNFNYVDAVVALDKFNAYLAITEYHYDANGELYIEDREATPLEKDIILTKKIGIIDFVKTYPMSRCIKDLIKFHEDVNSALKELLTL